MASDNAKVIIVNLAGVLVKKEQVTIVNGKAEIDFNGLSKGLYVVFLTTDKENIEFKIVKK